MEPSRARYPILNVTKGKYKGQIIHIKRQNGNVLLELGAIREEGQHVYKFVFLVICIINVKKKGRILSLLQS